MFSRVRRNCRRFTERALWILCCSSCFLCFLLVFLSLYYLEDHRERVACQHSSKERAESYGTLLASNQAEESARNYPGSIQELIGENIELKRKAKRLASFGSHPLDRRGLEERRLDYFQHIKDENMELKQTVKKLEDLGFSVENHQSWQERSLLKFITSEPSHVEQEFPSQGIEPFRLDSALGCREISMILIIDELGRGYTKLTQRGVYNGHEVAVKSVGLDSTDVHKCVEERRAKVPKDCLLFSRYKVMKELLLYQQLDHPNVVKLLGYCFQNDQDTTDIQNRGLTVVTELGTPLTLMTVVQMAWHQRFRIAVGLARLMKYFSSSPLGSLVIRDFQLIQFVIINDDVKLSDLDDVGNEEHACVSNQDCFIGNRTYNVSLPCVAGLCQGYNEKWNLYNLQRFYFKLFLLPGAPEHVAGDLQKIENEAVSLRYTSRSLVRDLEKVLVKLRNGEGLTTEKYKTRYQYKSIAHADFPGNHDYECDYSMSLVNCQSLVFDEVEAMRHCDEDDHCKAFVLSYNKSWIGYRMVYFKNNSTNMVFSAMNIVFLKIT